MKRRHKRERAFVFAASGRDWGHRSRVFRSLEFAFSDLRVDQTGFALGPDRCHFKKTCQYLFSLRSQVGFPEHADIKLLGELTSRFCLGSTCSSEGVPQGLPLISICPWAPHQAKGEVFRMLDLTWGDFWSRSISTVQNALSCSAYLGVESPPKPFDTLLPA